MTGQVGQYCPGEVSGFEIKQGLVSHGKVFRYYSTCNEKSLKGMNKGVFSNNYCDLYVIMNWKGARGKKRNKFRGTSVA